MKKNKLCVFLILLTEIFNHKFVFMNTRKNMIPKKIHYCWFGNVTKPKKVLNMIENWKSSMPDYEIIEWNESNVPFLNEFAKNALEEKQWAFVSDYVRLCVLKMYGGIYLDTDVEIIKPFDDLLMNRSFLCLESDRSICTAVIGAESQLSWINDLISIYDQCEDDGKYKIIDLVPNSNFFYIYFEKEYSRISEKGPCFFEDITIYTSEYFSPIDFNTKKIILTENTFAIHHFSATWLPKRVKIKKFITSRMRSLLGEKRFDKIKIKLLK